MGGRSVAALPAHPLASATNRFGAELFLASARSQTANDNLLLSPLSAALALGMALEGARGETARELESALHWSDTPTVSAELGPLVRRLSEGDGQDGVSLLSANHLWGRRDAGFAHDFVERLDRRYGAPLTELDFAADPVLASADINRWVSTQTRGLITELVSPVGITPDLSLVLTNALYFKADWATQFPVEATLSGNFRTPDGDVSASFMRRSGQFRYGELAGLQLVELPYRGNLAMLIALPRAVDGLAEIEQRMPNGLERWLAALSPRTAHVAIPRFRSSSSLDLREPLRALGVRRAFEPAADFSAMLEHPGRSLAVGMIVQQTRVEVDERGATAAAATAVGMYGLEARDEPRISASHPFLFLIRDTSTGLVLFIGRVEDPSRDG